MTLAYAGIGSPRTPAATLDHMTTIAAWLARTGWHLASGGSHGADAAFAERAPIDRRTLYLPWPSYNDHTGPDCVVPTDDRISAWSCLPAFLHPRSERFSREDRLLHARNSAILLGPRLDRPVNVVVTWTDRAGTGLGTGVALRIAAAFEIPVLNLATVSPRAACERLRDIAINPPPTLSPIQCSERLRDIALKPTPFVTGS